MASNSSFDVTTGVDYMEVNNAVTQATKEITQRYDFKGLKVGIELDSSQRQFKPGFRQWLKEFKGFFRMACKLGVRRATRGVFWGTLVKALWKNPKSIRYTGSLMALYLHFGQFSQYVAGKIREAIAVEERNPSKVAPPPPPVQMRVTKLVPTSQTG